MDSRFVKSKIFILHLFLFISSVQQVYAQEAYCTLYKEGEFVYADPEHKHWKIERVGEYQLEHSDKYEVLFVASLEWTDECTYHLQYVSISNEKYFDAFGRSIVCEIQAIDSDHYLVVATEEGKTSQYLMERNKSKPIVDGTPFSPVR